MLIKIFTLRFSPSLGGFDDEPVHAFMADKQIVSVESRFFVKDNVPYRAVLLLYETGMVPTGPLISVSQDRQGEDYRSILTDESTPVPGNARTNTNNVRTPRLAGRFLRLESGGGLSPG